MKNYLWVCAIGLTLTTSSSNADIVKVSGHMLPLITEELTPKISIPNCSNFYIVEWDGINNNEVMEEIKKVCKLVIDNFNSFLTEQNISKVKISDTIPWKISVISYDTNYRHLNDITYRFKDRSIKYTDDGEIKILLGYTNYNAKCSFIYNQIYKNNKINPKFITVLAHEMFHGLSFEFGILKNHPGSEIDKANKDEELALKFTKYLNLGI